MKTTTVYSGPGYPVDPKKEERRGAKNLDQYRCVMQPDPEVIDYCEQLDVTIARMVGVMCSPENITPDMPPERRAVRETLYNQLITGHWHESGHWAEGQTRIPICGMIASLSDGRKLPAISFKDDHLFSPLNGLKTGIRGKVFPAVRATLNLSTSGYFIARDCAEPSLELSSENENYEYQPG